MAMLTLARRWQRPSPRDCWLGLACLLALHSLVVIGLTQGEGALVKGLLVWGGALVVLHDQVADWQPRPSKLSLWAGMVLLLIVLWRSQQLLTLDRTSTALPMLAGLGLVLLAAPLRQLSQFRSALLILALMPLMVTLEVAIPAERLSLFTARITQMLLLLGDISAQVQGNEVQLPGGGGVQIHAGCNGIDMVSQLLGVGLIFALAFPMRHRWQNAVMLAVAPILAVLANGLRIGLLAVIVTSSLPSRTWWFDFFHQQAGSLVFSGIAVLVFASLYGWWMEWQVQQLEGP